MNPVFEETVSNLQSILDMWDVRYDYEDEKYVATSTSDNFIDPERMQWVLQCDVMVYSIQTIGDLTIVRFIDRKGGVP